MAYVCGLQVAYGTLPAQMPNNSLVEHSGRSNDINHGFAGEEFVWLVAVKDQNPNIACSSFLPTPHHEVIPTNQKIGAEAADFRYLTSVIDNVHRIVEIKLLRVRQNEAVVAPAGWHRSGDIIGMGACERLYLIWRLEPIPQN